MKKWFVAIALVTIGGLFALPQVASAQLDDPTAEGRGWLYAKGTGSVDIDMAGRLRLRIDGDLIITDHAGDVTVDIEGGAPQQAMTEGGTDIVLDDFRGRVRIQGSDFSVHFDGDVQLLAHGKGQAWLEGEGVYRGRYGDWKVWDGMVELGGAEVEPAA